MSVITLSGTVMAITNNYAKRRFKKQTDVEPMLSHFPDIQAMQKAALEKEGNQ